MKKEALAATLWFIFRSWLPALLTFDTPSVLVMLFWPKLRLVHPDFFESKIVKNKNMPRIKVSQKHFVWYHTQKHCSALQPIYEQVVLVNDVVLAIILAEAVYCLMWSLQGGNVPSHMIVLLTRTSTAVNCSRAFLASMLTSWDNRRSAQQYFCFQNYWKNAYFLDIWFKTVIDNENK